jgi:hypothetical protein
MQFGSVGYIIIVFISIVGLYKIGSSMSFAVGKKGTGEYPVYIEDDVMRPKKHGTCEKPAMANLRWKVDYGTADRICCFNRHYAEHSGYWETTSFLNEVRSIT